MSTKKDVVQLRESMVVKANALIQQSRFNLSLQQQKMVLYLIAQIDPGDDDFKLYEFSIADFCRVCGIVYDGKNYADLKRSIKQIADKSLWVKTEQGETLLRWIEKPYINSKSGVVRVRLDKDMKPFLLQLKKNFTSYELIYALHFKSKYTIKLYELLKSVHYHELDPYRWKCAVDDLRKTLCLDQDEKGNAIDLYPNYKNFKQRVLTPAIQEINESSDKAVVFEEVKDGRKVIALEFEIRTKPVTDRIAVISRIQADIDPSQAAVWDRMMQT